MTRKILSSVMVIALAAMLIGLGTFAYFSDTGTSTGNTFAAGTVDITLSGPLGIGSLTVPNMAPGDSTTQTLRVNNAGSLPIYFRGYLSGYTETDAGFIDQFTVVVTQSPGGDGYYVPDDAELYTGPLYGLYGTSGALVQNSPTFPPLPSGQTAVYKLVITLKSGTGNTYQGDSLTAAIVVDAIQSANVAKPIVW